MVWLLLFGLSARAECFLMDSLPEADAVDTYVDVAPWLRVGTDCTRDVVRLRRYTDHALLGEWPLLDGWVDGLAPREAWVLPEELDPETKYRLTAAAEGESDERNEVFLMYFTTGTERSPAVDWAQPTIALDYLRADGGEGISSYQATARGTLTFDPSWSGDLLVEVRSSWYDEGQVYRAYSDDGTSTLLAWDAEYSQHPQDLVAGYDPEMCVEARVISPGGIASDWSEPVCDFVEGEYGLGCAATGAPVGWLWLSALLFWRQRRASAVSPR